MCIGEQWKEEEEGGNEVEEEAGPARAIDGGMDGKLLAVKVEELVGAVKMLVVLMVCVVVVGVAYVLK